MPDEPKDPSKEGEDTQGAPPPRRAGRRRAGMDGDGWPQTGHRRGRNERYRMLESPDLRLLSPEQESVCTYVISLE